MMFQNKVANQEKVMDAIANDAIIGSSHKFHCASGQSNRLK
jgi:hypothetical protein